MSPLVLDGRLPDSLRTCASLAHSLKMLCIHSILVSIHDTSRDIDFEHVHLCFSELSRRHTLLKEHVHLGKGATHGLRDTEVRVHNAEETNAALIL